MKRLRRFLKAGKLLALDARIPRWTRVLLVVGLLPVPGPFDEAVLALAMVLLAIRHRPLVRQAWRNAGGAS